ncbi:MAG TPA: dicarboxylate/amino acid:cation symporter [Verrucomicrobiae bacterium]|nr:dicarboxylate/amino acid:cation symporter [Verrucomicrobiae bacterium]
MTFKRPPLHTSIFAAMILGAIVGKLFPQCVPWVQPLGMIFLRLLKLLVVPLTFISIVYGIASIGSMEKLSKMGAKTMGFYLTTNLLAVTTSLILSNVIKPGVGVTVFGSKPNAVPAPGPFWEVVPDNMFSAFVRADTMQIIVVALLFGAGLVFMGEKAKKLKQAAGEANELMMAITSGVIEFAPIGVFGLIATMAGSFDMSLLMGVGKFALTIILGLAIHFVTLSVMFRIFSNRPYGRFLKNMEPALMMSFSTSSSAATLPVTMECIEKKENISPEVAGFVLPLGATVNMDGTAIYEAAACLFIAQALGVHLALGQQIVVLVTAAMAAIGAAAVPSAGLVTLALVLNAVRLPLDGIGFLLAIDRPLDMARTIVNVWGDMVACAVVEEKKNKD